MRPVRSVMEAAKALCKAARKGDLGTLEELVSASPWSVNERNQDGRTALIVAIRHSHVPIVRFLISKGAHINGASTRSGATPVWHSAWKGASELTALLLQHGADPTREAEDCGTPLMVAAQYGHLDVVRLLLEYGAPVDHQQMHYSCTALWWACRSNRVDVVRMLLFHGADWDLRDWKGRTPFELALHKGHWGCAGAIEEAQRGMQVQRVRLLSDAHQCHLAMPCKRTRAGTKGSRLAHVADCLRERVQLGGSVPMVDFEGDGGPRSVGVGGKRRKLGAADVEAGGEGPGVIDDLWSASGPVVRFVCEEMKDSLFVELMSLLR